MRQLFRFISAFIVFLFYVQSAYSGDIDNARKYFYSGNYREAITYYKSSLKNSGIKKSEINYRIGLCYFMLGDFGKSSEYWNEAKSEDAAIFKAKTFRMPSGSMMPTLLIGDLVISDMEYYSFNNIERHDVVVLLSPKDKKTQYFKRVIALPGEKVEIKDKQLLINGKRLDTIKQYLTIPVLFRLRKTQETTSDQSLSPTVHTLCWEIIVTTLLTAAILELLINK